MPYDVRALRNAIAHTNVTVGALEESARAIIDTMFAGGFDAELVRGVSRMVRLAEHKRRQLQPALFATSQAFSVGRRVPIAQGWTD